MTTIADLSPIDELYRALGKVVELATTFAGRERFEKAVRELQDALYDGAA